MGFWKRFAFGNRNKPVVSSLPELWDSHALARRCAQLILRGKLRLHLIWVCPCGQAILWHGHSLLELTDAERVCPECHQRISFSAADCEVSFDVVQ